MMMIAGIALLVGGMAISVGAPIEAREARVLAERGVETTATVADVELRRLRRNTYAEVDLEFSDEFGLSQEAENVIYCGDEDDLAVGDEVGVTYDPDEVVPAQFTECPQSQEVTIPVIIGTVALIAGTILVLRRWSAGGWRRRWLGVPILIVGVLFAGTSFEDDCGCQEFVYTGAALVVLGVAPLLGPRIQGPRRPEVDPSVT